MAGRRWQDGTISLLVVLVVGGALWWLQSRRPAEPTPVTNVPTVTAPSSAAPGPALPAGSYRVQWVSDGDTVIVGDAKGSRLGNVRILGLDAPELAHNGTPAECFGTQARDRLRELVQGKVVRLVDDSRAPERDRFGRRLAYLEVGGTDVSEVMIRDGFAVELHLPSAGPGDRSADYARAEDAAAATRRGLWAACPAKPTTG